MASFSLKNVDMKMVNTKLLAINQQNGADCAFSVTSACGKNVRLPAIKRELLLASPFFEGLFNPSFMVDSDEIKISFTTAENFSIILHFAHFSVLPEEPCVKTVQEALELAIAADHVLMTELTGKSISLIESLVEVVTVWEILDKICGTALEKLASGCKKLLQTETMACLQHPAFLSAKAASVIFMLKMDKLNVTSERILFNKCEQWSLEKKNKSSSPTSMKLMRSLLPYLRLLTLGPEDAPSLVKLLTPLELGVVMSSLVSRKEPIDLPDTLCPIRSARIRCQGYQIKHYEIISDHTLEGQTDTTNVYNSRPLKNTLMFTARALVHLTALEFCPQVKRTSKKLTKNEQTGHFEMKEEEEKHTEAFRVKISQPYSDPIQLEVKFNSRDKSTFKFESPIPVLKDYTCTIEIESMRYDKKWFEREYKTIGRRELNSENDLFTRVCFYNRSVIGTADNGEPDNRVRKRFPDTYVLKRLLYVIKSQDF